MRPMTTFRPVALVAGLAAILLAAACDDTGAPGPLEPVMAGSQPSPDRERAGSGDLSVLTWNVYYGADLGVLLEPGFLPGQVARVFEQVQATDAPARAAAMADLIAASAPDLIGLQEVARYRLQTPGDFLDELGAVQNPVPNATDEVFDFVDLLLDALADRGLDYVEASRTTTFDVELPMFNGDPAPPWSDLRLTESVAILARAGLPTLNETGGTFSVSLPVGVGGFSVDVVKGWASVDATVKGRSYRFVTTHLEPADVGPGHSVVPQIAAIQHAQAGELLGVLEEAGMPVIVTGDLNSDVDGSTTDSYSMMREAGFVDSWLVGRPRGPGYTANQEADLLNVESQLWHRIDLVLYRDAFTEAGGPFRGSVHAERLGEEQADRTEAGLWPSDHAGVLVTLRPELKP